MTWVYTARIRAGKKLLVKDDRLALKVHAPDRRTPPVRLASWVADALQGWYQRDKAAPRKALISYE